jgi:acyl dehydratase
MEEKKKKEEAKEVFEILRDGKKIKKIIRGRFFEDFEVGERYYHHWGRTLTESDNILFSTLTMNYNPTYFNDEWAKKMGYKRAVINPLLVFNTVLGMSVEDLSEQALALLGYTDIKFPKPVYPGETIFAFSEVIEKRESKSRPEAGIVTFKTVGVNQDGEIVVEYKRSVLVKRREFIKKELEG